MIRALAVARDLLREARARKWTWALLLATTAVLGVVALGLELRVVDGALAASRFFGEGSLERGYRPADVALRPLFEGVSYVVFYGGLAFGVVACADFAPALLRPGRIEHLLSLPVRRRELVLGTFLGVLALVLAGALYGGLGLALIVFAKAGVFGWAPLVAALLSALGFAGLYAVMVAGAMLARSAALSAAVGALTLLLCVVAGYRGPVAQLFDPGLARQAFLAATAPLPRLPALAAQAARVANGLAPAPRELLVQAGGTVLFSAAVLAVAVALFERRDF